MGERGRPTAPPPTAEQAPNLSLSLTRFLFFGEAIFTIPFHTHHSVPSQGPARARATHTTLVVDSPGRHAPHHTKFHTFFFFFGKAIFPNGPHTGPRNAKGGEGEGKGGPQGRSRDRSACEVRFLAWSRDPVLGCVCRTGGRPCARKQRRRQCRGPQSGSACFAEKIQEAGGGPGPAGSPVVHYGAFVAELK